MSSNTRPDWTEEQVALLTEMWKSKTSSASKIATALTEKFVRPFSRNSVIGKAHRMGLKGAGALASKHRGRKPRVYAPKPKKPKPQIIIENPRMTSGELLAIVTDMVDRKRSEEPVIAIPPSRRVTILDLHAGVCRYPIGDPLEEDFTFCGAECDLTRPYCVEHHTLSYRPIVKKPKVAWRARR